MAATQWTKKADNATTTGQPAGTPIGLLLSLTYSGSNSSNLTQWANQATYSTDVAMIARTAAI